jgi:hypothetical protein
MATMKRDDKLEKELAGIPVPKVTESYHKDTLRHVLMEGSAAPSKKEVRISMKLKRAMILAVCAVFILATAAWATYQHFRQLEVRVTCNGDQATAVVTDENGNSKEYTLPIEGKMKDGMIGVKVNEDGVPEITDEFPAEIRSAFEGGNFTVVEESGAMCDGVTRTYFHYTFNLPDGKKLEFKSTRKLEEVFKEQDSQKEN